MTEELTRPTEKEMEAEIQASLLNTLVLLSTKFEPKPLTFTLQHRLASENPRVIEYCYSDRPDEIFTDHKLLQKHRGLTDEQVQQTINIYEHTK